MRVFQKPLFATKSLRKIKLEIKDLCLGALVAIFQILTFEFLICFACFTRAPLSLILKR